jgi:hypothetical protein
MFDVRAEKAYFNSSDTTLNAIVKLSSEFIYLGMSDTFVDTPGREDGQWMEDARYDRCLERFGSRTSASVTFSFLLS